MAKNQVIETFPQLIAPGETASMKVVAYNHYTVQYKIAAKNTSVDVNAQGSLDGINFFDLESSDVQQVANGTFYLSYANLPLTEIRFSFAAEDGGTTATIDVAIMATE